MQYSTNVNFPTVKNKTVFVYSIITHLLIKISSKEKKLKFLWSCKVKSINLIHYYFLFNINWSKL